MYHVDLEHVGKGGTVRFCDFRKSRKGDITYVCARTGRISREDIKVCVLYIRKNSRAEPGIIFSRFTYVYFLVGSNLWKKKYTYVLNYVLFVKLIEMNIYFEMYRLYSVLENELSKYLVLDFSKATLYRYLYDYNFQIN